MLFTSAITVCIVTGLTDDSRCWTKTTHTVWWSTMLRSTTLRIIAVKKTSGWESDTSTFSQLKVFFILCRVLLEGIISFISFQTRQFSIFIITILICGHSFSAKNSLVPSRHRLFVTHWIDFTITGLQQVCFAHMFSCLNVAQRKSAALCFASILLYSQTLISHTIERRLVKHIPDVSSKVWLVNSLRHISPNHSLNFIGVNTFEILPRLSTPGVFDGSWWRPVERLRSVECSTRLCDRPTDWLTGTQTGFIICPMLLFNVFVVVLILL